MSVLIYIIAFAFIILNNLIAEELISLFEKKQMVVFAWLVLIAILSLHIFVLGTGLRTIFGW